MGTYNIVDTGQTQFYGLTNTVSTRTEGQAFYGQDANYAGLQPAYQDNGDGTVSDLNTGLMWQKTVAGQEMTWQQALSYADSAVIAGKSDWRLPTIKELYSLIQFTGNTAQTAVTSTPYINTSYFNFSYGDTSSGERFIDAQEWSSTPYVSTTMNGDPTAFGVNFADGRIKGYPISIGNTTNTLDVRLVRGNPDYGKNQFVDNGDGTITDKATGLMWLKNDSTTAMTWEKALAYAESMNTAGHSDWRLPNAKELQSLVDYSRSPDTTASAAIDPIFQTTNIGTAQKPEYGFYWTGTSHVEGGTGDYAVYVAFGRALGWMQQKNGQYTLMDVHGAGSQRSDPKSGSASDYPYGHGPQGDVIRVDNMVRLVRDVSTDNSTFVGTSGDDQGYLSFSNGMVIDAGAGLDQLKISAAFSDVSLAKQAGALSITRLADGAKVTVRNAEILDFDQGSDVFFADNAVEGVVARLFHTFLNRDVSISEWPLVQNAVSAWFAGRLSSEAILSWFHAGNTALMALGDEAYLQAVYAHTLHRAASSAELSVGLAALQAGGSSARDALAVQLASSDEAITKIGTVMVFDGWV